MIESHAPFTFSQDFIEAMNSRKAEAPPDSWSREVLVKILGKAESDYKMAIEAYEKAHSAENEAFWEHNQASYKKGLRDALRNLVS